MFAGIKGLLGSGAGTSKKVKHAVIRPEANEGAKIPSPPSTHTVGKKTVSKPSGVTMVKGSSSTSAMVKIRKEPSISRDSASVVKPFTN